MKFELAAPLGSGDLQAAHVDTVSKVIRTIDAKHKAAFEAALPDLIAEAAAARATPDDLARALNRTARTLENDDGMSRFTQQRRDTALHTWTDKRSGMFRLSGRFDPLSGVVIHGHLQAMLAALFAERVPSTCPEHPAGKQDHLRALALLALIMQLQSAGLTVVPNQPAATPGTSSDEHNDEPDPYDGDSDSNGDLAEWSEFFRGGPSRFGRPEIVVVVDARGETLAANRGAPVVDWGLPVELPQRALEDLYKRADAHSVIVANGVVLFATGEMNLGRSARRRPQSVVPRAKWDA